MISLPRYRYGLFLRPPATLARVQADVHALLRAQYGLVAAGAFPPHMTILGHVATHAPDERVIDAAAEAVAGVPPVHLFNRGLALHHGGICHDIGSLRSGEPNPELLNLFRRAKSAFEPLLAELPGEYRGGVRDEEKFYGHMSLAAHDLALRPDLTQEVLRFLEELDIAAAGDYVVDTATLYKFETSTGWDAQWWEGMRWRHLRSFALKPADQLVDAAPARPHDQVEVGS